MSLFSFWAAYELLWNPQSCWAHALDDPYLNVNSEHRSKWPRHHLNLDLNERLRSMLTPTSCSTFTAQPSLNKTSIGRGCISYTGNLVIWDSRYAGSAKIRSIHTYGPSRPAVGWHRRRPSAGERSRQAPKAPHLRLPI